MADILDKAEMEIIALNKLTRSTAVLLLAEARRLREMLKGVMPYAQSRIEDMNETPDEHSAKATAIFEEAQRVIAEVEGRADG